jgi:hypothetical protein
MADHRPGAFGVLSMGCPRCGGHAVVRVQNSAGDFRYECRSGLRLVYPVFAGTVDVAVECHAAWSQDDEFERLGWKIYRKTCLWRRAYLFTYDQSVLNIQAGRRCGKTALAFAELKAKYDVE